MPDEPGASLDRLLAGELSAEEQRRLAQAALDDPELFDTLTAAAIVKETLASSSGSGSRQPVSRPATVPSTAGWRPRRTVIAFASAAALVLAVGYGWNVYKPGPPPIPAASSRRVAPAPGAGTATARSSAPIPGTPLLLTARLDAAIERPGTTFRTGDATSRFPKQSGRVLSVADSDVDIDLGSLDGITEGSSLRAFHGQDDAGEIGRVSIRAVFREHSRGRSASGVVQAGDRVDLPPGVHVSAILAQAAARRAAGDAGAARALLDLAVSRAQAPEVPAGVRRRTLFQHGRLRHENGALDEAERDFRAATDQFDAAPIAPPVERAEVLNELGAIEIERRDYGTARRTLQDAQAYATDAIRMRVMNNLGALAALGGDRAAAEDLYRQARARAGDSPALAADLQAIDTNLERLRDAR
jgi:Tfp pilus assembly protein PilF